MRPAELADRRPAGRRMLDETLLEAGPVAESPAPRLDGCRQRARPRPARARRKAAGPGRDPFAQATRVRRPEARRRKRLGLPRASGEAPPIRARQTLQEGTHIVERQAGDHDLLRGTAVAVSPRARAQQAVSRPRAVADLQWNGKDPSASQTTGPSMSAIESPCILVCSIDATVRLLLRLRAHPRRDRRLDRMTPAGRRASWTNWFRLETIERRPRRETRRARMAREAKTRSMNRFFWIIMAIMGGGLILLVANHDSGTVPALRPTISGAWSISACSPW
jgi:uncharacterized protein